MSLSKETKPKSILLNQSLLNITHFPHLASNLFFLKGPVHIKVWLI